MAKVIVPTFLRTSASRDEHVTGSTVREVLDKLCKNYPDLRRHLFNDQGELRSFVNVYVNDEDVRYLKKDLTPVGPDDIISIVPSIAGGPGPTAEWRGREQRETAIGTGSSTTNPTGADEPTTAFWQAPWEFAVHTFVGSIIFLLIALPAVLLEYAGRALTLYGISSVISILLKAAEYTLFGTDFLLFTVFLWRAAKRTLHRM
jgi:molybdopterin synthase sulfur carrier subunit